VTQWLVDAHQELTEKPLPKLSVRYSGRFKGFNASVRYGRGWMEFSLAKNWLDVDEDIKKGVVQHLLCKIYSLKQDTLSIRLYEEFLRQASEYAPKGVSDELLTQRFKVINEEYFDGLMESPTLKWGSYSLTKLGHYEYATDTVVLSTALQEDQDMLDYVLYHELLHKKHKFSCHNGRTHHHTKAFKKDEAKFRLKDADKSLERYISAKRREKRQAKPKKKRGWFW
jgi:hypothetical protein